MEFLDPQEAEKFKIQKCIQYCGTPCRIGNSPESVEDLINDDDIPNEGILKDNEDQTENEYAEGYINFHSSLYEVFKLFFHE